MAEAFLQVHTHQTWKTHNTQNDNTSVIHNKTCVLGNKTDLGHFYALKQGEGRVCGEKKNNKVT